MLFQHSPPLIFFTIEVGGAIYPVGYRLIRVITSSCKSAFLFVKETNKPALELGFHRARLKKPSIEKMSLGFEQAPPPPPLEAIPEIKTILARCSLISFIRKQSKRSYEAYQILLNFSQIIYPLFSPWHILFLFLCS